MRLTVLGSADATNSSGRAHSCYWLDGAGPQGVMVDFGATALKQIKTFGKSSSELGTILFTHLHGDHVGGFPFLLVEAMYPIGRDPRSEPLTVVGPIGTKERLMALIAVTYGKLATKPWSFDVTWIELEPGASHGLPGLRVETFPADHMSPPEQPLCLRVTADGGVSVAFSGDTRMCDGLRDAGRGVDLLVAECTGLAPPSGKHCTWEDWSRELPTIGAKSVLLTHLSTPVRDAIPRLLSEAPEGAARLSFADDGLVIEIEANTPS